MIHMISEQNFHQAWWKAIQNVMKQNKIGTEYQEKPLRFGVPPKTAFDSTQLVELSGYAIKQVLNGEIHPMSTFRAIDSYKRQFTYEFHKEWLKQPTNMKSDYLYFDRLTSNEVFYLDYMTDEYGIDHWDQIEQMKYKIKEQKETHISSNYSMATTWYVGIDGTDRKSSPCLQIIQLRWNPGDLIDMHLIWRSRDLYSAWQANIIAITTMINNECILPNDCKLNKITDYSTSLHIYEGDVEQAKRVIPMVMPR